MKATGLNSFMARIDAAEYGLCCRLNRGAHRRVPRRVFQIASRLGDGVVWYALILALPVLYGAAAVKPAVAMGLTGALGVALYTLLKRLFVRERPFITHRGISRATFLSSAGYCCRSPHCSPARASYSACTIRRTCSPERPSARRWRSLASHSPEATRGRRGAPFRAWR